ncbi:ADP-ribose glycohydrolase MACROD2 isoform X1 [Onychostoma macrolepis]|uniref:ADP-ribose glycohydrolase MACROD2 isoform X1 n=1 Tax=Onychostoma macrolepis TaxID=369639 RepID=UPI00272CDF57|nr:ADP-ribose glycohydrolase MACROD2 isoform X1 [Onychostoma macrolepis]
MSKKKKEWRAEKERLLSLGVEDRRKDYRGNYVPLDKIPTWANHDNNTATEEEQKSFSLADKVSLYKGDITTLEVDAIVNAANSSLLGGGGVDGCIHRAAGHLLYEECHSLNGCDTGKAKITCGYDLPAKYVIHTVGPIARGNVGQSQRDDLESCYKYSLKLMKDNNLRSVAFPCISTGIYGFPNEPAAEIALKIAHDWIQSNQDEIDRVIFCVFLETDYEIYKRKMSDFFSPDNDDHKNEKDAGMEEGNTEPVEGGEEDDADKKDDKQDEEIMSQQDESTEDVTMQSQEPEGESPDAKSMDEETKPPEKGDATVEVSPTAKKKVEQESEKDTGKKEDKGEDPPVAGEEKGGSPEKKMQTGQPDEAGKQMEESTKSEDPGADTGQEPEVPMEVLEADQSVTTAKESNTSNSTKDDVKAQDKSSQEPDATPPDTRPNSEDGQGDKNPQE